MKRFLIGKRISMHALGEADLAEDAPYFSWLDNLELDQHTARSRLSNTREKHMAYVAKANKNDSLVLLGIYLNAENGRHIGNISIKDIDRYNRRGWIGYLIGDKSLHGKGIATEAVQMFTYYCFKKLNLNRIYTTVSTDNVASVRVLHKSGYQDEGLMRQHIILGDQTTDVLMLGAVASEWLLRQGEAARNLFETSWF